MTKIEQVARAICIAAGNEPETWASMPSVRGKCMKQARAAIEAMREPTENMVFAARMHHEGQAYLPHSVFNSMIDAALQEQQP